MRKWPLCHSWIVLTFQTTEYKVLVGSSDLLSYGTCRLLDTFPSSRYMLLLACSDTPERTYTEKRGLAMSFRQLVSRHSFARVTHSVTPPGNTRKWAFEPLHCVVQPASGRRPAAPPGWAPSLGSGVCGAGSSAVSATEDGSWVTSKRAGLRWILYRHSLYLHLWPGQTYTFT